MTILLLSALLLSFPSAQAAHERDALYRPIDPIFTGLSEDGGNIATLLQGEVSFMGNNSVLDWEMNYRESEGFFFILLCSGQVSGIAYRQPATPIIVCSVDLNPGVQHDFDFSVWNEAEEGAHNTDFTLIQFVTPTVDDPFGTTGHPLAPHIESLGIPVDITLAVIGLLIMAAPVLIVSILSREIGNDVFLPLILLSLSANTFLRFWPPVLVIFIGLLTGWMVVSVLTGGMTRLSSGTSQPT